MNEKLRPVVTFLPLSLICLHLNLSLIEFGLNERKWRTFGAVGWAWVGPWTGESTFDQCVFRDIPEQRWFQSRPCPSWNCPRSSEPRDQSRCSTRIRCQLAANENEFVSHRLITQSGRCKKNHCSLDFSWTLIVLIPLDSPWKALSKVFWLQFDWNLNKISIWI